MHAGLVLRIDYCDGHVKRNMLKLMYDQSKDVDNVQENHCKITLRSTNKGKMKSSFTRLTKVIKSPYYRGLELWNSLPKRLQKEPSKIKFKSTIKKYNLYLNCETGIDTLNLTLLPNNVWSIPCYYVFLCSLYEIVQFYEILDSMEDL